MKKIPLIKVRQKDKTFYCGVVDPRILVELIPKYEAKEEQDLQRPWEKPKVDEIANYVAGRVPMSDTYKATGLIPNAPILNIKDKLVIQSDADSNPYIELPDQKSEFDEYQDAIEVIDGQHRIRAFGEDFRKPTFKDSTPYEMIFSIFDRATTPEKEELFMITNEMQTKVAANLLRSYRKSLGLFSKTDEDVYDFVLYMNSEDISPLKDRITVGARRIKKGYQENQVSKILYKSGSFHAITGLCGGDRDKMLRLLTHYLAAWESVYNVSFKDPQQDTLTKISGLRYILFMFPDFLNILTNEKSAASKENFISLINDLPAAVSVDSIFENNMAFRGEGATTQLAKDHVQCLKMYRQSKGETYNPAENL